MKKIILITVEFTCRQFGQHSDTSYRIFYIYSSNKPLRITDQRNNNKNTRNVCYFKLNKSCRSFFSIVKRKIKQEYTQLTAHTHIYKIK